MVKAPGYDRWKSVQHAEFDGLFENNFPETSLHFSFTGYEQSLNTGEHGLRDKEVYFLQGVVQAYERGNWVADLDILSALNSPAADTSIRRLPCQCEHTKGEASSFGSFDPITSIDCWDELLDDPKVTSIVRAKGNWLARLAVTVVAFQKKRRVILAKDTVCWACVRAMSKASGSAIIIC
jgi:hypothetical protein